ncbi:uncharacterized protein LOC110980795 isoform X2 [Acanthaster planci]|uniref:poly(ADP-ribose) glycohydrolase n=1 Tax=Acanthaster planci TaxID=133434 RepID=A0A8B7YJN5_ACAPL|nr:uncharacterized protein LOC110980795 isoform X2 [Acanthaster planci]
MVNQEPGPALLEGGTVPLPCDGPGWAGLRAALAGLGAVASPEGLLPSLGRVYRAAHPAQLSWHTGRPLAPTPHPFLGLGHFLEHVASEAEQERFFQRVLPTIARLAGHIEAWRPQEAIQYMVQQQESSVCLDRRFVASVVANAFLCTFPKQPNPQLNSINFDEFFQFLICSSTKNSQAAKLRCILNYFDRLADVDMERDLTGQISYIRQVLGEGEAMSLEGWLDSKVKLCPLTIKHKGLIEDAGSHALQVDFANRFLGGGTLLASRQQEEIRFCTCPELLAALLFTESLQDNEAVVVAGFEQFSEYTGYSSTLKFSGDHKGCAERNSSGDLNNTLIAIDAMPWTGYLHNQYRPEHLLRELNKAYVGFCYPKASEASVSTGQEEADSSSYHDALDQSLVSTDGAEFETASSGDDRSRKSSCNSTLQAYGSSLSRAITDIAIKDVTGSYPRPSLPRDESSVTSLSTVLTASNASTPVNEGSPRKLPGIAGEVAALEGYATGLAQDVLKEGGASGTGEGTRSDANTEGYKVEAQLEHQAMTLVREVISSAVGTVRERNEQDIPEKATASCDGENSKEESLRASGDAVDGATSSDVRMSGSTLAVMAPPLKQNESQAGLEFHSGESRSSKGSLADYSIISSASGQSSEGFVKLNGDADLAYRQRHPNQAFSAEVLAADIMQDALATLHKHFNIRSGIPTTISSDSLNLSESHSEMSAARDRSGSFDMLTSGDISSSPSLSEYVRVNPFSLDGLAEDIMSSAFQQLQQILEEKASRDMNGNQKNNKMVILSDTDESLRNSLNNNAPSDYEALAQEDIRNGNTLRSSTQDSISREENRRTGAADSFAERLVGHVFNDSLLDLQNQSLLSNNRVRHHEEPDTPPPSPTDPAEMEASLQASQSFDKSLVTISEQPAIEEPQPLYLGDKRLSADSSGTESSQSREARIRECAEQLVARTLPESMRLLGGSAQTTSSSSSRRTSSPRSSIPDSSNRSSLDCFTEDLLRIGNINPTGKRPSRTEESLAFFAQEIKRMAEAEEKSSKKQKEDFADFAIELQRGSTRAQPDESPAMHSQSLEVLADRYSVQVISDVFVQLYGEPWSEAEHSDPEEENEMQSTSECVLSVTEHPQRRPSEQDLMSLASNLANSILEAALRVYREEHLHLPDVHVNLDAGSSDLGHDQCSPPEKADGDATSFKTCTLDEFASVTVDAATEEAFTHLTKFLKDGGRLVQEVDEVGPTGQRPISTGNWGCGAFGGDPQLKSLIQWMVASQVGCPRMIYYSFGDERVSRLQRVVTEITSRQWTVGDLLGAVLDHSWLTLNVDAEPLNLFDRIINSG